VRVRPLDFKAFGHLTRHEMGRNDKLGSTNQLNSLNDRQAMAPLNDVFLVIQDTWDAFLFVTYLDGLISNEMSANKQQQLSVK
jgi:hypothetical protein